MEKKVAVYICSGCGIGDVIDTDKLGKISTEDGDASYSRTRRP